MAAQPDISSILAALAQQQQQPQPNGTPQQSATPQHPPPNQPPPGFPPGVIPGAPPSAPPQTSYLPQPSNTGSVDLSSIKPINSGSVSIADAIAKARNIAGERGVQSYDHRAASSTPREDPRLAGRGGQRSRSRSRSPPRRDNYGGNPYRDERREDPRRGAYRRSPSPERNFRGARDPPMGNRGSDGETETIRVKSSLVGLIIGRNGENLRKVESETGARVQFIQTKDAHTAERQCTISGTLRARENAKTAIFTIIEENGGTPTQPEKGGYTAGMAGRAKVNLPALREGEASTQIMVPDKTVGLIIGRGGETIKDLQERSGCHVNIVGENKSVNGLRPVNLIGSERATALAKELILEIVESDNRGGGTQSAAPQGRDRGYDNPNFNTRGGGGGGAGGSSGGRDHIEKTIQVPSEAVGMIIGKGGETIKDMQRTTGCKINVNQPKPPDHHRNIDLAGTARSMQEAERIIWEKVETVRQRDQAAGRNHGQGRDQGASQYDAYSQQQQAPPAVPGYGQFMNAPAPQVPPQMPAFQMPVQQQATPQPGAQQSSEQQQALAQWYAQWYASQQQQQQHQGAPGAQ
ncbi:related to P element somatic inhibitor [Lecanosticta acicola]|uniref:Related to P element somatic inhibitor n=1 Tax=Lecanosticta acicola TaxID=111012 RepID=A0AAI8Z970_9PEZI|nr:related to P element somatic inhibitor [Lecanosticta acicola]